VSSFRFGDFTISGQRRVLLRGSHELPLIPRYFDLLFFLIEHRHEAVHRQQIFDHVWRGVIVSDSALSQAIRTLRRTLGDDSREPRFIRTVSRHGYQFVFAPVVEERASENVTREVETPRAPVAELIASRLQQAARSTPVQWAGAATGAGIAGLIAGAIGGVGLMLAPGSSAPAAVIPVLAMTGGLAGAIGGAGVGAGISVGDASTRSMRASAVVVGAALGGMIVGAATEWLATWTLSAMVGLNVPIGGTFEGVVIGTAAGVGYLVATARPMRSPVLLMALLCGAAALLITQLGRPLVGGTIHLIAREAQGSLTLTPLATLFGDPEFGRVPQALLGTGEGLVFGLGLAMGLGYRLFSRTSHETLTRV
jgi:DNA-binding winged helix-turn-helix (wHTH) protein